MFACCLWRVVELCLRVLLLFNGCLCSLLVVVVCWFLCVVVGIRSLLFVVFVVVCRCRCSLLFVRCCLLVGCVVLAV